MVLTARIKKILLDRRYNKPLFIYSRFVWNDHLVSCFSLRHCCGIDRNLLLLTFSRAESQESQVTYNEATNELTI